MSLLELDDVHSYYGNIHALMGISLRVEQGEIVALIGANGAGKTTTLRSISGLLHPRKGKVLLEGNDGRPPARAHRAQARAWAWCPKAGASFPVSPSLENLEMGAYILNDKDEIQKGIDNAFNLFPRLKERAQQKGGTLSGGEQQMLATARGLMSNPKILLMDEPSMGLAPVLVDQIFDIIKELNARGHHHPAGGAERPDGPVHRPPRLRAADRPHRPHRHRPESQGQ